jgi:hypothetical protein
MHARVRAAGSDLPLEHYDLFAVSNHHGILGGGHYVAHGLLQETGQWYNFNDSAVTPIPASEIGGLHPPPPPPPPSPSVGACGVLMADAPTVSALPSLAVTPASYMLFYRRCDGRPAHHQSGRPAVLSQPFLSRFSAAESVRRPTQAKHRPHRLPAAEAPPEIHAHRVRVLFCLIADCF